MENKMMKTTYLILASLILSIANCSEQQFMPEIPTVQELFDTTFPFMNKIDDIVHAVMDDTNFNPNDQCHISGCDRSWNCYNPGHICCKNICGACNDIEC